MDQTKINNSQDYDNSINPSLNLDYILKLENITKTFLNGKIVANDNITLNIERNKIHSIIGENGSGKSTLMSILFGLYKQDQGKIILNNQEVDMYHSGAAKKQKIGMVHQHFHLIERFTILENVLLGQEEKFSKAKVINYRQATKHFNEISERFNLDLTPTQKVSKLNVGQKQKVEIMKVLWEEKDIIIFDEPTATLSVKEIDDLLKIIHLLKEKGKTIIFISHKLQEVKKLSDNISILNKGVLKGTFKNTQELTTKDIANLMFNDISEAKLDNENRKINHQNVILSIKDLVYDTSSGFRALNGVSFDIKEGEIFGLAGIEGNGQEEIINCITGLKKVTTGNIILNINNSTKEITSSSIKERNKYLAHVPIDRLKYGLVSDLSIEFNSTISDLNNPRFGRFSFRGKNIILSNKVVKQHAREIIEMMNVDGANDIESPIRNLSGGNQQKFIVGREIKKNHQLMVAGHPTRGLDIKAINNIYQKVIDNSVSKATLIYSLEISELMNVCDRIAILYKGKIVDIIDPHVTTIQQISKLMIGEKNA